MKKEIFYKLAIEVFYYISPCIITIIIAIPSFVDFYFEDNSGAIIQFIVLIFFGVLILFCVLAAFAFRATVKRNVLKIWLYEAVFLILFFACFYFYGYLA